MDARPTPDEHSKGATMAEKMILTFPVQPALRGQFADALTAALPDTRAFKGNLRAEMWLPENSDGAVWVYEEWEARDHQAAYFQWRVDTGLLDAIGPMLAGAPEVIWLSES
jgi:quinol monooxygenase YgiN